MNRRKTPKRPKAEPNRRRLNDRFVKSVSPSDKRVLHWDTVQHGLVLQVEPTGHKTYKLYYRFEKRPRWFHIDDAQAIGLTAAREAARARREEVIDGIDVQATKLAATRAGTFKEVADQYREEFAKRRNKSWQQADYLVRLHVLTEPAMTIVRELEDGDEGFVFGGARGGPVTGLDAAMRSICEDIGIRQPDKITPHDLRRTHGTLVTSLGFSRDAMNRIQNHKEGGIGSVYDQYSYADEHRQIQEAVASRIGGLTGDREAGKIITMRSS